MSALEEARERIRAAYDPEVFHNQGMSFVSRLAEYFREATQRPSPSVPWVMPEERVRWAKSALERRHDFETAIGDALAGGHRFHSPHYLGHQVPPPLPVAGLFDALASLTNQGGALYEMSPFFTAAERAVVEALGRQIGWRSGFDGIGTSGGTLANLTAILTARNVRYADGWRKGIASAGGVPAIVVGEDAHYSIARAAGILGIGTDHVWKVPGDSRRRMTAEALDQVLSAAEKAGHEVFCIVAACGSTPVGAFDPLTPLASVARRRGIWFHVDGAHGASVLFSRHHRALADGIDHADSVTWDAHKMLFVPSLATFLLYRDGKHSFQTFQQEAPYLFDPSDGGYNAFDGGLRTLECTKHTLVAGLWGAWCLYGPELFGDLVDVTFARARELYELLKGSPDFEVLPDAPQGNIVCFRHSPAGQVLSEQQLDRLQGSLRRRLMEKGGFYLTATRLGDRRYLRVTVMNPLVEYAHLTGLRDTLRELGKSGS